MSDSRISSSYRNTPRSKYHAQKVITEEGVFDSKKEFGRWIVLKNKEENGEIQKLERQKKFELIPSQPLPEPKILRKGKKTYTERAVFYIADFAYIENGKPVVEDVKGVRTPEYVIKRKLMLKRYGIQVREI